MQFNAARVSRNLILALILGAILVPLAPDTGAVIADTSIPQRISAAHDLAALR